MGQGILPVTHPSAGNTEPCRQQIYLLASRCVKEEARLLPGDRQGDWGLPPCWGLSDASWLHPAAEPSGFPPGAPTCATAADWRLSGAAEPCPGAPACAASLPEGPAACSWGSGCWLLLVGLPEAAAARDSAAAATCSSSERWPSIWGIALTVCCSRPAALQTRDALCYGVGADGHAFAWPAHKQSGCSASCAAYDQAMGSTFCAAAHQATNNGSTHCSMTMHHLVHPRGPIAGSVEA